MNWCHDFQLDSDEIENCFTFAKLCTKNVFRQVFQYKINTYILPSNEYLKRYRVSDSDLCERCQIETDTIIHRLWECEKIVDFLEILLDSEANWVNRGRRITLREYLFGVHDNTGVNHFWLEVKMFLFYNWNSGENVEITCNRFKNKLRNKFTLIWTRLKLGYNSRLKHKSNWNFCTSY